MRECFPQSLCFTSALLLSGVNCGDSSVSDGTSSIGADAARTDTAEPDANLPLTLADKPLIDHDGWRAYPASEDPLESHQPDSIDCGLAGWYIEKFYYAAPVLEVNTGFCNYALLEHPSLVTVRAGDAVTFELRYYDLNAAEPAQAHIAILFDDEVQWQTQVAIPSPAAANTYTWTATRDLAAGEPIRLHLHNHGQNTWLVSKLHALVAAD